MKVRGIDLPLVAILSDLDPGPPDPTRRASPSPNVRWAALPHEQIIDTSHLDVYVWGLTICFGRCGNHMQVSDPALVHAVFRQVMNLPMK